MSRTNIYETHELGILWGNNAFLVMMTMMLNLEDELYCVIDSNENSKFIYEYGLLH